jgi:hypothetical protein
MVHMAVSLPNGKSPEHWSWVMALQVWLDELAKLLGLCKPEFLAEELGDSACVGCL